MTERQLRDRKRLNKKVSQLEKDCKYYKEQSNAIHETREEYKMFLKQIQDIFKSSKTPLHYGLQTRDEKPEYWQLTSWVADMVSENEMMSLRIDNLERHNNHIMRVLAKDPTLKIEFEEKFKRTENNHMIDPNFGRL